MRHNNTIKSANWRTERADRFISAHPSSATASTEKQLISVYDGLEHALTEAGATRDEVVFERIFFENVERDLPLAISFRKRFYDGHAQPAFSYVQAPPALPGMCVSLSAHCVSGADTTQSICEDSVSLREVSCRDSTRLFVSGIVSPMPEAVFLEEAKAVFQRANEVLQRRGFRFQDVVRTWLFLSDIRRHYGDLNIARSEFLNKQRITTFPASTGVGASSPGAACLSMDLIAEVGTDCKITAVTSPEHINLPSDYGSRFSRALSVATDRVKTVYVSGTASVDRYGKSAHAKDINGQIEKMLSNIRGLLSAACDKPRIMSALGYVRSIADGKRVAMNLEEFLRDETMAPTPMNVVVANLCRPELLCETELIALEGR